MQPKFLIWSGPLGFEREDTRGVGEGIGRGGNDVNIALNFEIPKK